MKIVKADSKGRVTGFEPGQRYTVVEEAEAQWVKTSYMEEVTGDLVGQVVGLVLGDGITLWGVLKLLQRKEAGVIFILDGKDYGYGSEDYENTPVTHVWVKR